MWGGPGTRFVPSRSSMISVFLSFRVRKFSSALFLTTFKQMKTFDSICKVTERDFFPFQKWIPVEANIKQRELGLKLNPEGPHSLVRLMLRRNYPDEQKRASRQVTETTSGRFL